MFSWLKRPAKSSPPAEDENARLKRLTTEAENLQAAGLLDKARSRYEEVLGADPNDLLVIYQLATILQQQDDLPEARRICEQGLAREPDQLGLRARHGDICKNSGDYPAALADYQRIRQLDPDFPSVDAHLADIYCFLGRGRDGVEAFDRALARDPDSPTLQSNRLFVLNYFKLLDRDALFEEHRKWGAMHEARLRPHWLPFDLDHDAERKLRVGYVSPDLRNHAVAFFIEGVLREHDRQCFEIHCFDVSPFAEDNVTARLKSYTDGWYRVREFNDAELAAAIRAARIDILIDLSGHTAHNRLLVFAHRPAPVQVSWFGYMNTTGLTAIDYRLTDSYMDPPGISERYYTETLYRIPAMACFTPAPESPPVSPLPSSKSGVFTFGSVNQWTKVTEDVKDLWASILRESEQFRLLIVASGAENPGLRDEIVAQFVRRGAKAAQIAVFATRPLIDFLRLYEQIDVVLDPFPYGGGTTSLHSLWMGVPIVTIEGESEMSRACAGIVRAVGLDQFVALTPQSYRQIAANASTNPSGLATIRTALRAKMAGSALTAAAPLAREIEKAYRCTWHNYCTSFSSQFESPKVGENRIPCQR